MELLWVIPLTLILCMFGFILRKVMHTIGLLCQFCGNHRTTPFAELPHLDQENLIRYFQDHEKRNPDCEGIFVCQSCNTVYDDFSGEKRSMDADGLRIRVFCKVCNGMISGYAQKNAVITCQYCQTEHRWQTHAQSGFSILMPPPKSTVLKSCRDHTMGIM